MSTPSRTSTARTIAVRLRPDPTVVLTQLAASLTIATVAALLIAAVGVLGALHP